MLKEKTEREQSESKHMWKTKTVPGKKKEKN